MRIEHLEYECCMVCDSEGALIGQASAEPKQILCPVCRSKVPPSAALSQLSFIEHLDSLSDRYLDSLQFIPCVTSHNAIDDYLMMRGYWGPSFEQALDDTIQYLQEKK